MKWHVPSRPGVPTGYSTRRAGKPSSIFFIRSGERRRHPGLVNAADAIDMSALFDDWEDPVYIDLYHLSEAGNSAVAAAMLPTLVTVVNRLQRGAQSAAGGI